MGQVILLLGSVGRHVVRGFRYRIGAAGRGLGAAEAGWPFRWLDRFLGLSGLGFSF